MIEIEKPRIECQESPDDISYGKFVVEPLERGYGTTLGNSLRDGAAFDAVICGCDVQQTFCWQPGMCITDACEAEYRPLLDAEIRILAAAPGERFSIIEICTDRLFLGDAFSQCAAGYCGPREYRRLFRAG